MENIISQQDITEEDIIKTALSGNLPLSSYVWELEKLQTAVTQRIQILAGNYHENILNHQSSLQGLGTNIKDLLKKAQNLQQRTGKLGNELEVSLDKMTDNVKKLEKVQQASEVVRLAQQFFIKTKKTRSGDNKEIDELASKLRGITVIDKLHREKIITN